MKILTHNDLLTKSTAVFSDCERYRYLLSRVWDDSLPMVNYLMLNPSTADHLANDPTVERCQRRAADLAFGGFVVTNLFAFRSTDPTAMKAYMGDPIGEENDRYIRESALNCSMVICAWGNHGKFQKRSAAVVELLRTLCPDKLHYLKLSGEGQPCHPLYIGYDVQPQLWRAA